MDKLAKTPRQRSSQRVPPNLVEPSGPIRDEQGRLVAYCGSSDLVPAIKRAAEKARTITQHPRRRQAVKHLKKQTRKAQSPPKSRRVKASKLSSGLISNI